MLPGQFARPRVGPAHSWRREAGWSQHLKQNQGYAAGRNIVHCKMAVKTYFTEFYTVIDIEKGVIEKMLISKVGQISF
jgi:hypothetical protein